MNANCFILHYFQLCWMLVHTYIHSCWSIVRLYEVRFCAVSHTNCKYNVFFLIKLNVMCVYAV